MPKRSRDKQLAKLANRRAAERRAAKRRRDLTIGLVAGGVAVVLLAVGGVILLADEDPAAVASATPSTEPIAGCSTEVPAAASKQKPTFAKPPKIAIDPAKTYTATIDTSCGTIVAELLPDTATEATNSFVFLARKGFYDGLTWHRIVPGFVIQGGDPEGVGTGGPGYEIPVTVTKGVSFDAAGRLAFAHAATGGNGSQFFITLAPAENLDPSPQGRYTIFGSVTKGQKVVDRIGAIPTTPEERPTQTVYIDTVTIEESSGPGGS